MRVFSLTTGADTAGIGVGLARAFRGSGVTFTSMVASPNYIGYPVDEPYDHARLEALYDEADVVLLHGTVSGHHWYDAGQGKPTVLMHHGRTPPDRFRSAVADARRIGAVQVGSTIDLGVKSPDVTWAPAPVDIAAMRAIRSRAAASPVLRVGHAPTNRALKGTDVFLAALDRLSRSIAVEVVLIEGRPWIECLALKATCDVFFDQLHLGYGSNAIEAWAMGIPVLAGVADGDVRDAMLAMWGVLPFMETSVSRLEADLRTMLLEREVRDMYADRGTAHVARWHADAVVAERMTPIFADARPTAPGGRLRRRTGGLTTPFR